MEIETYGKIVQIIEDKKASKYGFYKQKNSDYLNIRPYEERNIPKKVRWGLIISLLIWIGLGFVHPLFFLIFLLELIVTVILGEKWISRKVKEQWYFDPPIAIKKPHKFKVGDYVKITIYIKKTEPNYNIIIS